MSEIELHLTVKEIKMNKNLEILLWGTDEEFHNLLRELRDRQNEEKSSD